MKSIKITLAVLAFGLFTITANAQSSNRHGGGDKGQKCTTNTQKAKHTKAPAKAHKKVATAKTAPAKRPQAKAPQQKKQKVGHSGTEARAQQPRKQKVEQPSSEARVPQQRKHKTERTSSEVSVETPSTPTPTY